MIKRTLYFGNPCYLKKKDMQMHIDFPEKENKPPAIIPIEDVGVVVLDNPHITLTNALIAELNQNNTAIISCDAKHLPFGLMLPMFAHHAFTEKMYQQLECSLPLKKNLWQQTIIAKISNQAAILRSLGINDSKMQYYLKLVKSGDPQNVEGRAAAYYWENLFGTESSFSRDRLGENPNAMLNYGYAVLLAIVARGLVSSGLLPAVGIHHRNKYNPWCLASDIMEPYRPYVDRVVLEVVKRFPDQDELTPEIKKQLLQIPAIDVDIDGKSSPLMVGLQRTTASLSACFEGSSRKLLYPELKI
ncbi:MAG: type II CRISPR-associated endonuclease Cas1 [Bacteroidetes bacterium HGW-Bacteroidetes-1]|jgi:CRISPR-associated protein Cas1|nr:MAG: type II CRISPR-associated endonuclease Cas1 [Bacteroidetes bacterium HGW-Bacteroidetes-1]